MLILKPVESVIELFVEDMQEHPLGWLKFLFIESPIGWVIVGVMSVLLFLIYSTMRYWLC